MGSGFCDGGVKKYKIMSDFLKLSPYFEPLRVKITSHIGGVGPSKKVEKFPLKKIPNLEGGFWRGWDGFPTFTGFEL